MVEGLADLPKVQAPAGFLSRVHDRLEKESPAKKIVNALFVPFRIKIPLELATATALGILIFFIVQPIHRQQVYKKEEVKKEDIQNMQEVQTARQHPPEPADALLAEAPASPPEAAGLKDEEKLSAEILKKERKISSYDRPASPPKGQMPARAPAEELETMAIQDRSVSGPIILSFIPSGLAERDESRSRGLEGRSSEMFKYSFETTKQKTVGLAGAAKPAEKKEEHDLAGPSVQAMKISPETIEQNIIHLVDELKGSVIHVERDDTGRTNSIQVEIPSANYDLFTHRMKAFGDFVSIPPEITVQPVQQVQLIIHLSAQP
jgi:hypothetical protein